MQRLLEKNEKPLESDLLRTLNAISAELEMPHPYSKGNSTEAIKIGFESALKQLKTKYEKTLERRVALEQEECCLESRIAKLRYAYEMFVLQEARQIPLPTGDENP
jgi:hypothetical protein